MLRLLNNVFEQLFNKKNFKLFLPLFQYFWIGVFSPAFIDTWTLSYGHRKPYGSRLNVSGMGWVENYLKTNGLKWSDVKVESSEAEFR